jgi:hypothetical protein
MKLCIERSYAILEQCQLSNVHLYFVRQTQLNPIKILADNSKV